MGELGQSFLFLDAYQLFVSAACLRKNVTNLILNNFNKLYWFP